jgi:hypothetical protein
MRSSTGESRGLSKVRSIIPLAGSEADRDLDVMTGFNGTLFCYGQTGSGKTYSQLFTPHRTYKLT